MDVVILLSLSNWKYHEMTSSSQIGLFPDCNDGGEPSNERNEKDYQTIIDSRLID